MAGRRKGTEKDQELILNGVRYRLVPVEEEATRPENTTLESGALAGLTARERQIAARVADGLGNKEIAAVLAISEWTVATHLRRIFAKLGVDTRAAMVYRCSNGFDEKKGGTDG